MSAQCSVFVATSLDGFIARSDGNIDWLNQANASVPAGEDCGYKAFMATIDLLVMGRKTFEQVLDFDTWPYGETPVIVMTHHQDTLPPGRPSTVSVSNETPPALVARLSAQGAKRLYIDGGLTVQCFLGAHLISDITITTIPILLGSGKRLFGALTAELSLAHERTVAYAFGFVQTRYRVLDET